MEVTANTKPSDTSEVVTADQFVGELLRQQVHKFRKLQLALQPKSHGPSEPGAKRRKVDDEARSVSGQIAYQLCELLGVDPLADIEALESRTTFVAPSVFGGRRLTLSKR